ncbi:OmpA family protein [Paracoccus pacificus]|uniref:OmpA family protein n=1 Tax=Paracoccus pacificus TaxID=1463598 RepID=A0ABW4R6V9_9RHOB
MKARISLLGGAAALIALGACTDPYATGTVGTAGGTGMSNTQKGAIAGAVIGGVLGGTRDKDKNNQGRDAARGAILGAAAGALAGNIMDNQARALEQSIQNPNVRVVNNGQYLTVTMPQDVLFATDSTAVSSASQSDLYAVARNLQQYPNTRVEVIGHTDDTGSAAYNQDLSQRRASAVANVLIAGGVPTSRVSAVGRGESQPVASNADASGRAKNRRVELIIRPM